MKYHWIGFNQQGDDKNLKIHIPQNTPILSSGSVVIPSSDDESPIFQPQIIQIPHDSSLVVNMTKPQVIESCTQLLKKKISNKGMLELAIVDCVISNYQDTIIENSIKEESRRSTTNRQVQLRKNNSLKVCNESIRSENYSNETEKQLLLGICISKTQ